MTESQQQEARAAFEAWASGPRRDMDLARFSEAPPTYVDEVTEWAWLAYLAATLRLTNRVTVLEQIPREPTPEMVEAWLRRSRRPRNDELITEIWQVMYDAALAKEPR